MAEASFPVDLANPGQVFACLGLMEAAEVLLGEAEGGFDWQNEVKPQFTLRAAEESNPVGAVLDFLAEADPNAFPPPGSGFDASKAVTFPSATPDKNTLPILLGGGNWPQIVLSHWADGSSRNSFKLYSGNRSALTIAQAMLKGIKDLWDGKESGIVQEPFHALAPMGGSFNFDPRGTWSAIDAGYSPNEHDHQVVASPLVELLAAWGLEHARPRKENSGHVRYAVWGTMLPVMLARPAMAGTLPSIPARHFRFRLGHSGKNSIVTFAEEVSAP